MLSHDKLLPAMQKPIIALDLDGTLLSMGDLMHPHDKYLLLNCTEVNFVLASGRQRFGIRKSMLANGLFDDSPIPFPMVLINGGALYAPGEKLIETRPFSPWVQTQLIHRFDRFKDIPFLWQAIDQIYLMHPTPFVEDLLKAIGVVALPVDKATGDDPFYKIICWSDDPSHLATAQHAMQDEPVETFVGMERTIEFNPRGVDKGEGIMRLLRLLRVENVDVYAVGDSENDLPMLHSAKVSFVPATALNSIQQQAKVIIDTAPNGLLQPILDYIL